MDAFRHAATFYREVYGHGREPASLPKETSGRLAMLKAWLERACQLELTHWTQDEQTDTLTDTRRVHDVYRRFLFFYFATIAALSASRGVLANLVAVEPVRTALMARLVALSRRTTDLVTSVSTSSSSSSSALAASEAERFTDTLECLVRERLAVLGLGACLSLLELGDAWITPLVALLLEQLHAGYLELGQMPATAVAFQKSSLQAHWLDTLCTWILVICREPNECTLSPTDAERMSAERQTSWTRSPDPWKREESELSTDCITCSFQRTGCQFHAQHWYRCATCSFADDEGICTACALVCHAGHEVSYARFSGFFCDCGAASTNSMVVCCRLRTTEATRKQASCSASSQITPNQHDGDLEKRTEGVLLGQAESEGSLPEALQEPAHDLFAFMARFPVAMEHLWESWASAYLAKMSIPSVDSAEHVPSITAPWMERIRDQLMWLRQEALHPSFYIGSMWKGSESSMVPETDDTMRSDMSSSTAAEAQASIPTATETGRAPPDPTEHNAVPIRNASGAILYKRLEWAPCTTQMLTRVRHLDQVQGIPRLGMDMCLDSTTKAGNLEDTKRLGASIDPSLVFADGLVMVVVPGLGTHGHQVTGLDLANVTGAERTGRSFTNEEAVARAASEGVSSATRTTNTSSPSSAWLSPALDTRSWERLPLGIGAGTIRFSGTWRRPGKPQRLLVMNHESSRLRLFSRNCTALSAQMHLRNTLQANQPFIWSIDAERIASATTVETAGRKTSDTQARQASNPCIFGPSSDEALAAAAVSLQHWRHTSEAHDVPYLLLPLHRMVTITAFTPTSDGVGYASGPLGATSPPPGPMSFENTAFVESTTRMNRGSTGATPARLSSASTGASASPSETENRAHNADTQRAWTQHLLLERKALDNGQAIGEASWLDAYADDWLLLLGQDRKCIEVCSLSYVCTCWICRLIRAVHGEHDNEPNPLFPMLGEPFSSSSSSAEQTEATPTPATRTEYLEWVCWDAADTAIDATTGAARVQDDGSVSPLDAWVASSSSTNDDSAMASPLVHHDQQVFETTREMGVEPCWAPDASKEHDPWRMTWQRRFVLDWNPRACLEAAHSTQSTASRVSASTELANSLGDLTAHVHAPLQAWTHGRVVLDARDVSLSPPGRLLLFLMLANNHLLVYGYVAAPWTTITSGSPTEDAVLLASMQLAAPSRALTAPAAPIEQGTGEVSSVASETGTQVTGLYYDDTAQELDLFWSNGYWNRWRVRWLANNVRDGCSGENTLDRHPMHEDEQTPFWSWSARQLLLEPVAEEPLFCVDAASTIRLQSVQQMPVLSSGHRSYAMDRRLFLLLLHNQPELCMVWLPKTNLNMQHDLTIHDLGVEPATSWTTSERSDALDRTLVVWTPSLESADASTDSKRRMEHHLVLERCHRPRRLIQATGVAFWQPLQSGDAFGLELDLALVYEDGTVMGLMTSLSWPFNAPTRDPSASLQVPSDCNQSRGVMTSSSVRAQDPLQRMSPLHTPAARTHGVIYSSRDQSTLKIASSSVAHSTRCSTAPRLGTATIWPLNKDEHSAASTTNALRLGNSTLMVLADQRTSRGCLVGFFDALEQVPHEALSFSGDFWRLGLSSVASVVQWAKRWPRRTSGSVQAIQPRASLASGDARFRNAEHVPEALFWQIAPIGRGSASVASAHLDLVVTTMDDASWALLGIRLAWLRIRSATTGDAQSGSTRSMTVALRGDVDAVDSSSTGSSASSRLQLTPLQDPKAALPADIQCDWLWMECCCDDPAALSLNPSCRQVTLTVPEAVSWSSPAWLVLGTVQVYGLRLSSPALDRWLLFLNWRQQHPVAETREPETSPERSNSSGDSVKAPRCMVQRPPACQVRCLLRRALISICLALVNGFGSDLHHHAAATELEQTWYALLWEGMLWGQAQRHGYAPNPLDAWSEPQQGHVHDDCWPLAGWLGRHWPRVMHLLERVLHKRALLLTSRLGGGEASSPITALDMALERFANTERQQASRYAEAMCSLSRVAERGPLSSLRTDACDVDGRLVYPQLASIALSWAVHGLVALVETVPYLSRTSTERGFPVSPWSACARLYVQTAVLFWHELEENQSDGDMLVDGFVRAAGTFLEWLASRERPRSESSLELLSWLFEPFAFHPRDHVVVSFLDCWLGAANVDDKRASSQRHRFLRWHCWSRWLVAILFRYTRASPEDGRTSSSDGHTTNPSAMAAVDVERRLCLLMRASLDPSRADGHWQILLEALSVLAGRSRPDQVMRIMAMLASDKPALQPSFRSLTEWSSTLFRGQHTIHGWTVLETLWLVSAYGAGLEHALATKRREMLSNVSTETPYLVQTQTDAGVLFDWMPADVTWPQTAFEIWIRRFQQQWRADTPVDSRQWLDAYASLVLAAFCLQRIQCMEKEALPTALIGQRGGSRADALQYAAIESIEVALWDWFGTGVQFGFLHRAPKALQLLLGVLVRSASAVQAAMALAAQRQILVALEHPRHPRRRDGSASLPSGLEASTYWDRWQRQQRLEQAAAWMSAANDAVLGDDWSRSLSPLLPMLLQLLTSALAQDDHRSVRGVLRLLLQAIRNVPVSMTLDLARSCWKLLRTLMMMMHTSARQVYQQAVVSMLVRMLDVAACSTTGGDPDRREQRATRVTWLKSLVQRYAMLYGIGPFSSTSTAVDEMIDVLMMQLEAIADQDVSSWTSTVSNGHVHDSSSARCSLQPSLCSGCVPVPGLGPSGSDPNRVLDVIPSSWHAASLVCPDCRDDARRWLVCRHGTAAASLLAGQVQRQSLRTLASQLRYDDCVLEATWPVPRRLRRLGIRMLRCRTTLVIYGIRVHLRRCTLAPLGMTCSNATNMTAANGEATTQGPLRHRPQVMGDASSEWTCCFEILYRQDGSILAVLSQWTAQPERQPADWGVATGLRLEFLRCSGRTSLPETVSCPRCARLVTERGGICPGCKENVYQCRACRFIDYGRLNALLCRECGHSRYLRYEVELETSAVDPLHQVQSRAAQRRGQALLPSSSHAPTVTTPPGLASSPTRDAPSARPQSSETRDAQSYAGADTQRSVDVLVDTSTTPDDLLIGLGADERAAALEDWWSNASPVQTLPLACGRCAVRRRPALWQQFLETMQRAAPMSVVEWRQRLAPLLTQLMASSFSGLWSQQQQQQQRNPSGPSLLDSERTIQGWPRPAKQAWMQLLEEAALQLGMDKSSAEALFDWRRAAWQSLVREVCTWEGLHLPSPVTEPDRLLDPMACVEVVVASPTALFPDRALYLAALYGQRWRMRSGQRLLERGHWARSVLRPSRLVASGTLWPALFHPYAPTVRRWALGVLARHPTHCLGLFHARVLLYGCLQVERHGYVDLMEAYWQLWRWLWQQQEAWIVFWDACGGLELLCVVVLGIARGLPMEEAWPRMPAREVFTWAPYLRQRLLEEWIQLIREAVERIQQLHWTRTAFRSLLKTFEVLYCEDSRELAAQLANIIRHVTERAPLLARWQARWMVERLKRHALSATDENNADDPLSN